jgi:hypothetical protein
MAAFEALSAFNLRISSPRCAMAAVIRSTADASVAVILNGVDSHPRPVFTTGTLDAMVGTHRCIFNAKTFMDDCKNKLKCTIRSCRELTFILFLSTKRRVESLCASQAYRFATVSTVHLRPLMTTNGKQQTQPEKPTATKKPCRERPWTKAVKILLGTLGFESKVSGRQVGHIESLGFVTILAKERRSLLLCFVISGICIALHSIWKNCVIFACPDVNFRRI